MKKINTSNVTSTSKQPLYGRSITHLQEGYIEALDGICKSLLYGYTSAKFVILDGCKLTGSYSGAGNPYSVSAGSVYYQGEIYQVAAASGTISGTNVLYGAFTTTYQTGDPVTMSDGSTKNVHEIRTIVITQGATGGNDYSKWLRLNANPVHAKLTTTGVTGSSTTLLTGWDATYLDDDGIFNYSNGRLTPAIGYYNISLAVKISPSLSPSTSIDLRIYKNGVLFDTVIYDSLLGTNAIRTIQFNNYIIQQTVSTDYWTFQINGGVTGNTYSARLTVEPANNKHYKLF